MCVTFFMCQNFYEKHFRNLFNFFLLLAPKNNILKFLNFLVFKCFFFFCIFRKVKVKFLIFWPTPSVTPHHNSYTFFHHFFILNIIFSTFLINFLIKKLNGKKFLMLFPLLLLCARIIFVVFFCYFIEN